MLVNQNNKVLENANGKVIINDPINEFLGTVSTLWNNPANWSLGILPNANSIAIIRADCDANVGVTIRGLINNANLTIYSVLVVSSFVTNNQKIIAINNESRYLAFNGTAPNLIAGNIDPISLVATLQDTPINITDIVTGKTVIRISVLSSDVTLNVNLTGILISFAGIGTINNKTLNLGAGVNRIEGTFSGVGAAAVVLGGGYNGFIVNMVNMVEVVGITVDYYRLSANDSSLLKTIIKGGTFKAWYGTNLPFSQTVFNTGNCILTTAGNIPSALGSFLVDGVTVDHNRNGLSEYPRLTISGLSGTNNASIFNNKSYLGYAGDNGHLDLMPANGKFYCDFEHSAVEYWKTGDQFIKVPDDKYRELRLSTSGVKKLTGNTVCDHLYFSGTATLGLNGFALTGCTKYTDTGNMARTIPQFNYANIEFTNENLSATQTFASGSTVDEVIYRGGQFNNLSFVMNGVVPTLWRFIRQFSQQINNVNVTFSSIRLEIQGGAPGGLSLNNANVIITGNLDYRRNGGVAYTRASSLTCNTLIFSASAQSIIGNLTFTNMEIRGTGIKTLAMDIVVSGTYYRDTANTTLVKNGFTIKDSLGNDLE